MEDLTPQTDNIQYNQRVLELCVTRGCQNKSIQEVLLKYIKKSAPICEKCIIEFRQLGFIEEELHTLEEEGH